MTAPKKRLLQFLLTLALLYAGLFLFFRFTEEQTQYVTDHWLLSSKSDPLLYPLLQIVTLVLVLAGLWLGLWLAYRMLLSDYRRFWFGGFFILLGAAGIAIWSVVLNAEERSGTGHIPSIGGGLIALGLAILLFFKLKGENRE